MAMDAYYAQDRLQEIWKKINTLHMSYLEMEESPQKLEQRNKLEDCIKEYLCLAPHNQKFYFQETAEVLHRSARSKDFSGYRAALGWQAIGMYAGNLLSQPWRPEYREIKTYSGFFVHQISTNLVNAEIMFEAMGYRSIGNGILVLDGPVCPDRVTQVSQDSLVAYMECQILKAIWEEVSKTYKVTWLEVLEFRENHLCSPKQSVQSLNYRYHQRQYQEHNRSYSQGTDPYQLNSRYPANVHQLSNVISTNYSFPPLSSHSHVPVQAPLPPPPHYMYGANGCYPNNYSTYSQILPQPSQHYQFPPAVGMPYQQPIMKPHFHTNNFYSNYSNGYIPPAPQQNYSYPIPTGQLIEIESQSSNSYDMPDGAPKAVHKPAYTTTHTNDLYRNKEELEIKNTNSNRDTDREEGSGTFENWDYVYRNLESQGYSKDLGERGDVLSPPLGADRKHSVKEAKKVRSVDLEDGMLNLSINRPLKMNDALEKCKQLDRDKRKENNENKNYDITQSSSYDNLSIQDTLPKTQLAQKSSSSKTLPRDKLLVSDKPEATYNNTKSSQSKTIDVKKGKKLSDTEKGKSNVQEGKSGSKYVDYEEGASGPSKWECKTCTFLNTFSAKICEMCGKSRNSIAQDMEVGGSQCSFCTLVNRKDLKKCEACGNSLKDSPTYI